MLRKATPKDCKTVYHFLCELENKKLPYEQFTAIFQRQLDSEIYCCLLYEQEGAVAGVLNLRFEEQLHHAARIAEIMEFAVGAPYRRRGIGKEMLAYAYRLAKDCGCTQLEVACNQLRTDAHRFYLREGMHNFHFKFSAPLESEDTAENQIGR